MAARPDTTAEQNAAATQVNFVYESLGENFFVLINPGRNDYPNQNLLQKA